MICIQAIMNPIGIGIGWGLANQGNLITGIFESISAGSFFFFGSEGKIRNLINLKNVNVIYIKILYKIL